nr:hypothetical protein Q903MT_gene1832 [Picea sitchensis]
MKRLVILLKVITFGLSFFATSQAPIIKRRSNNESSTTSLITLSPLDFPDFSSFAIRGVLQRRTGRQLVSP